MNDREIMNTRLPKKNIYQIEDLIGISKRCDWFIHHNQILKQKEIPNIIFLSNYQGKITIPFFYNKVLPHIDNKIILIIASEDYTFPSGNGDSRGNFYGQNQNLIQNLINHSKIKRIWVENLDTLHPKLSPLPLGVLKYYNYHLIKNLINFNPINLDNRINKVLSCHRIHVGEQFNKRKIVSNLCQTKWKKFVTYFPNLSNPNFLKEMKKSTFVLCVNGGGIDPSPKCWEAILCGTIPIIEHSTLDEAYSQLPVVYINKWEDLTEELLDKFLKEKRKYFEDKVLRQKVLEKLTLNYWWNNIVNNV